MNTNPQQQRGDDRVNLVRENLKQDLAQPAKEPPSFPTVWQAVETKRLLNSLSIPVELVEDIMDFAEYWPSSCTTMEDSVAVLSDGRARCTEFYSTQFTYHHWVPETFGDTELLCTEPLAVAKPAAPEKKYASWAVQNLRNLKFRSKEPGSGQSMMLPARGRRPCRKIIFSIVSREDSRDSSVCTTSSWFEAALKSNSEDSTSQDPYTKRTQSVTSTVNGSVGRRRPPKLPNPSFYNSMHSLWLPSGRRLRNVEPASVATDPDEETSLDRQTRALIFENGANSRLNKHGVVTWRYDDNTEETYPEEGNGRIRVNSTGYKVLKEMEIGDSIILRARVKQTVWPCMNYVVSARVCTYWAV
ncbi:MAG: hypothetical protein Q9191_001812 [Dirinaria sp. TL-2023a]